MGLLWSSPIPTSRITAHSKTSSPEGCESRILDQNSKQITIILRSFRWSAGTDCHLSQQTSGLTLIDLSDLQSDAPEFCSQSPKTQSLLWYFCPSK